MSDEIAMRFVTGPKTNVGWRAPETRLRCDPGQYHFNGRGHTYGNRWLACA